jgi:hypothetical protein
MTLGDWGEGGCARSMRVERECARRIRPADEVTERAPSVALFQFGVEYAHESEGT